MRKSSCQLSAVSGQLSAKDRRLGRTLLTRARLLTTDDLLSKSHRRTFGGMNALPLPSPNACKPDRMTCCDGFPHCMHASLLFRLLGWACTRAKRRACPPKAPERSDGEGRVGLVSGPLNSAARRRILMLLAGQAGHRSDHRSRLSFFLSDLG